MEEIKIERGAQSHPITSRGETDFIKDAKPMWTSWNRFQIIEKSAS